jgi:putative endopeptidase
MPKRTVLYRLQRLTRGAAVFGLAALGAVIMVLGAAPDAAAENPSPEIGPWGVDLDARDPDVVPGNDFFDYASGHWLATYEIPQDLPGFGSFVKLFLRSEDQVRDIIEETAKGGGEPGSVAQKVADLYNGFLDTDALDAKGLEPLAPYLDKIRAAATPADVARLLAEFDRIDGGGFGGGGTTPFAFYIDQDEKDPTAYIPHFMQSGLGLPDRDYYLKKDNPRFAEALKVYREYLEKLLAYAGLDDPGMRADLILALETKLAEAHWPAEETRDLDKTYNKMTVDDMAKLAPEFPWGDYMKTEGMGTQKTYIVMEPSAFAGMAKVFKETPIDVWQDFLTYRLLRNNAPFLPKAVDDIQFEFVSKAITGAKGSIGEAVGQLYVEKYFTPTAKERIDELVNNLLIAMGERIKHLDWMSDATKMAAQEKLSKFAVKIGYPDEWRDYSGLEIKKGDLFGNAVRARAFTHDFHVNKLGKPVNRKEWFMTPQTVNAYYNGNMNEIVFPAAILQPPFFDPYADPAVNYGAIGAVIGHEIGHGFDDQGRKSDGDGVFRDWWTEEDAARFKEKADMLVKQYSGFSPLEGMTINGELTLGENIGDLGGLEIAYSAYKLSLGGKEAPVIDGLTGDQRFFLGFAQVWKGKMRDEILTNQLASDPHSPVRFRVNGVLPNMDEWYAAFHVGPDDSMYLPPDKRVRIW